MADRGITYVAWDEGIKEAERSALSAKKFGLKTCLIGSAYAGDVFDKFIMTEQELKCAAQKVFLYHLSPWAETLYMDSDTTVLGDLTFGFDMARRHGIAVTFAPACFVNFHWGLNRENLPPEVPDYNGGVIFFKRRHPKMRDFWRLLQKELERVDWADKRHNLVYNDQSMLSAVLYKKGLNPYVLPQNWNLRPQYGLVKGYGPVKIWHSRYPIPEDFDTQQSGRWTLVVKNIPKEGSWRARNRDNDKNRI
ncbi:MAG: hypothetical protein A2Z72_01375 [Omnitrophica bacterium RBG_13_46_9]|nr:MAG: hypothetical protein A2Z72_01375 [Omnitrophica bacterium RBG_13_46_9]